MPTRSRQGSTAAAEVEEPEEGAEGLRSLKFDQPLTWRVGRAAISIADLLQRLQTLSQELRKLEQEEVDKESFKKVSQELASSHLLAHKDKGVRAWAACCIVDVLRLCAPDAPFTGNQIKDIFTCVVSSIIPALADPSNTYNAQHIYVLSSLAEVKSVVLMTDLDQPDSLIVPLFTSCFDIVSGSSKASTGEEIAKNVEFDMTRLLVTVIDESPILAPEIVDVIVAQFLRVDPRAMENPGKRGRKADAPVDAKQDTLLLKDYPPAYNMSKAICQACPERMTSHISQYFNNVIIDASGAAKTNGSSKQSHKKPNLDDSDEEAEDIKELSKAHRLIRELWKACPEVLQNVVPQLEAELSTESVSLRLLATQTIGDLTAGIGVAGPPPPPPMDPTSYPPVTLVEYSQMIPQPNPILTPFSPKPFSQAHASAYDSFLGRRQDKSSSVRAAWVTVVGRILLTSAGGSGLGESEEHDLVKNLASMLRDGDEKVRLAAVDAVGRFGLSHIVQKLGISGGVSTPDSVLSILAERVKDRKLQVREHAMRTLARMWAVAAGEIEQNNEQVVSLLKDAPSRIFDAYYTNDRDIQVSIDRVLFEILLPLNYPPIKPKLSRGGSSQSQKLKDSQGSEADSETDIDRIRVRRVLTLLRGLDDKAKKVFFAMQARQLNLRSFMTIYLEHCEEYNGGVVEKSEKEVKAKLGKVIETFAGQFPDGSRASADLWKFVKAHDRRSYQLIRYAMAATSDYRTVVKAIRELAKRLQSANNSALLETLTPVLYRCSSLVFNRSHIPAIMSLSRADENGLANAAHEMLREVSSRNPEVLEAQVQEMCKDLESKAPKNATADDSGSEEILKACSGFAKKLPSKLPKERKFLQALTNYALYSSSPQSGKYAVSILMACADKKEMYARDLVQKCATKWKYGNDRFLTKLATLSQLNLLAPREADEQGDTIISIAVNQILPTNRSPETKSGYTWSDTMDEETTAKQWALKIVVNRLRAKGGSDSEADFRAHAEPVYSTLNKLVANEGELSKEKDTPATQKSRLRLLAAKSLLKLCAAHSLCDQLLTPRDFNFIALVAQDQIARVRTGFINQLKKKLVQKSHLSLRWYTVPCLLAFEPTVSLRESTLTWLRSRAAFFQNQSSGKKGEQQTVMESIFSRLLSLLAHHPDYPTTDLDESTRLPELADFARYIIFYLQAVADERNLSLIFHIAQRVKQTRDGITKSDTITTNLHTLSDLAQATIRHFADIYSAQHKFGGGGSGGTNILQTYPGKMGVPSSIFAAMNSHREAQEVAEKNFLPDELDDLLDQIVRSAMRNKSASHGQAKKRKPDSATGDTNGDAAGPAKKARMAKPQPQRQRPRKSSSSTGGATPKVPPKRKMKEDEDGWSSGGDEDATMKENKAPTSAARRRSSRGTTKKGVSYADRDSDDDDVEMAEWDEPEKGDDDAAEENESESESDKEEQEQDPEPEKDKDANEDPDPYTIDSDTLPPQPAKGKAKGRPKGKATATKQTAKQQQPTIEAAIRRSSRR